jgi:hypothetical protein
VVGPIILFADNQGVCLVELWLWKKLLWAVNCEKSWCELWTVKKLMWAVSCEKVESRLATTAVSCEKSCCLLENVYNTPEVIFKLIITVLFTNSHANYPFRKGILIFLSFAFIKMYDRLWLMELRIFLHEYIEQVLKMGRIINFAFISVVLEHRKKNKFVYSNWGSKVRFYNVSAV